MNSNKSEFLDGIKSGIPIGLGYFAVGFSLGIVGKNVGLNAFQGFIASLFTLASAGGFAGFNAIGGNAGYFAIIGITLIANLRYILLSSALSQKIDYKISKVHRFLISAFVTDEIFGVSISKKGKVNPYFIYGNAIVAAPAWGLSVALGIVFGNILPDKIVSALSVALFGMFIAVVVPKSREDKKILILVIISAVLSGIFAFAPLISELSSSTQIIILTILISSIASLICPIEAEEEAIDE